MKVGVISLAMVFVGVFLVAGLVQGQTVYPYGYVWNRYEQYSTNAGPHKDSMGVGVWRYEGIEDGTGLDKPDDNNRWYKKPYTYIFTYYPDWGYWTYHTYYHPGAWSTVVYHHTWDESNWRRSPRVVWLAPTSNVSQVRVEGQYRVAWVKDHPSVTTINTNAIDVVFAHKSGNNYTLLEARTLERTNQSTTVGETSAWYSISALVPLQPGDQIVYGLYCRTNMPGTSGGGAAWLFDENIKIVFPHTGLLMQLR